MKFPPNSAVFVANNRCIMFDESHDVVLCQTVMRNIKFCAKVHPSIDVRTVRSLCTFSIFETCFEVCTRDQIINGDIYLKKEAKTGETIILHGNEWNFRSVFETRLKNCDDPNLDKESANRFLLEGIQYALKKIFFDAAHKERCLIHVWITGPREDFLFNDCWTHWLSTKILMRR